MNNNSNTHTPTDKGISPSTSSKTDTPSSSHFIRQHIERDLAQGTYQRPHLPAVVTRFPPEPNGYLHIGHAKSICLNFGMANAYKGKCHLRFDDTNPAKEEQEYVDSIRDIVHWMGFDVGTHEYFASDYFPKLYAFAQALITAGLAYVDSQSADEMRERRGTLIAAGINSPFRNRMVAENLDLFARMKQGEFAEGTHVLRAKIDMASANINMRDPALYRIRHAHHHRTGTQWCIYPMYDYAHCVSDALEGISHSLCTLEFEDHRPLYNWLLQHLRDLGQINNPLPQQIEFARLNLSYTLTSKRKLQQLVQEGHVKGWDDPRLPTLAGLRRRGYTPQALSLFCDRVGVSRADSWIDIEVLEQSLRDDLDTRANRLCAVLHPIKLTLTNWHEEMPADTEICTAPRHPHDPERGQRHFPLSAQLYIDRDDFRPQAEKGFFRLFPGNRVRLRYGVVIECERFTQDENGQINEVFARVLPNSKSGTAGADNYKVKGNIHWLSVPHARPAQFNVYERLFTQAQPEANGQDFLAALNPHSHTCLHGFIEPMSADEDLQQALQFERHGYFVLDRVHPSAAPQSHHNDAVRSNTHASSDMLVFNYSVSLKDAKQGKGK